LSSATSGEKQNKETGVDFYTLTFRVHGFGVNLAKAANRTACPRSSPGGAKVVA